VRKILIVLFLFFLLGCAGSTIDSLRDPVPEQFLSNTVVPGYSRIRYWGDDANGIPSEIISQVATQQLSSGNVNPQRSYLSVSGGGSNGAFGAGVLVGWTESGKRPEFTIVTGISTGSLVAPFAFLGPPYDRQLKAAYTETSSKDIYKKKGFLRIVGSESIAESTPLRKLVEQYVTDAMLEDIAREHARGRRLLIGTTNLDAERPVVWDIGAIASSQVTTRRKLVIDLIIASASIPGVFPPVKLKVVADGQLYEEIHVDGGTSNQAFLFPSNFSVGSVDKKYNTRRTRTLYVLRNGKVSPEYSVVKPKLASIIGKSISSLIKTQGIGDLYRMYSNARRDKIAFKAIWVPESFTEKETAPFDQKYMNNLFQVGYKMGQEGIPWASQPP
jgi:predicted patatin/cPLA2 family phospholipase